MNIIAWIIFGLIAGVIANVLFPEKSEGGAFGAILLGIAGAFVGGLIGSLFIGADVTGFNFGSFILAIGGALLLLFLARFLRRT